MRNVSTAADQPKALVRNAFNHSIPGQPAGVGIRDFSAQWVTPAPATSFAIPKGCSNAETEAEADGAWGLMGYGDR